MLNEHEHTVHSINNSDYHCYEKKSLEENRNDLKLKFCFLPSLLLTWIQRNQTANADSKKGYFLV